MKKTHPMTRLFHLFELDRLYTTKESTDGATLVRLAGGLAGMDYFSNIQEEYRKSNLRFPERMWRIQGNDFIIDVFDEGNGWYQVVQFKVRRRKGE